MVKGFAQYGIKSVVQVSFTKFLLLLHILHKMSKLWQISLFKCSRHPVSLKLALTLSVSSCTCLSVITESSNSICQQRTEDCRYEDRSPTYYTGASLTSCLLDSSNLLHVGLSSKQIAAFINSNVVVF